MKTVTIAVILISFTLLSTSAYAGNTNSPGVDKRQHNQVKRIKHGVRNGALTGREAVRLGANQARIRHMERRLKSDGHLSGRERARLHRQLNHSSRRIYRKKHNARTR